MKKSINIFMAIVLALGLLLCSCSNDVWTKDIDFPETKGFDDKTFRGVEYGVSYNSYIDKKFFETYQLQYTFELFIVVCIVCIVTCCCCC